MAIGLGSKQFCLHSLHCGDASATSNAGVPPPPNSVFKRHGIWHSKSDKDGRMVMSQVILSSAQWYHKKWVCKDYFIALSLHLYHAIIQLFC